MKISKIDCSCFDRNILTHQPMILIKKISTPAGFEPARAEPNRFQVCRLNHSAIVPDILKN